MSTGVGVRPRLSDAKVGLELLSPSPQSSRDITLDVVLSPGGGTEEGVPGEALETSEAVERAVLWVDGLGARMLSRLEGNLIHGGRTEPVLSCVSAVIGSHRFRPSSTGILSGLRMPMELDRYAIGMARLANAIIASVRKMERVAKAEIDACLTRGKVGQTCTMQHVTASSLGLAKKKDANELVACAYN